MNKLILLILLFVILGCSKNEESKEIGADIFLTDLKAASSVYELKENLPEWLAVRIDDYYETRTPSFCKVMIYRGEWNKQTIYFILDTYSACLCDFYTEDGERIVDNLSDLRVTSKNWVLIYEYGDFVLNLDELFSN